MDRRLFSVPSGWAGVIDVEFDGHRVFSTAPWEAHPEADGTRTAARPRPIVPYLHGETELTFRDHLTRAVLAEQTVRFDGADRRVSVTDDDGLRLSVSKWGSLRHTFTESADTMGAHYLEDLDRFFEVAREIDTDADISYLSRYDSPGEIAAEGFRIERELRRRGWGTFRNTAGYLKVWAPGRTRTDNFDVFTCYVIGDFLAVDRWVRGPGSRNTVLPWAR